MIYFLVSLVFTNAKNTGTASVLFNRWREQKPNFFRIIYVWRIWEGKTDTKGSLIWQSTANFKITYYLPFDLYLLNRFMYKTDFPLLKILSIKISKIGSINKFLCSLTEVRCFLWSFSLKRGFCTLPIVSHLFNFMHSKKIGNK